MEKIALHEIKIKGCDGPSFSFSQEEGIMGGLPGTNKETHQFCWKIVT